MFGWLKKKPVVDNTPVAEYNFGPYTRVMVKSPVIPAIGTIITLGKVEVNLAYLRQERLCDNDMATFEEGCYRWQVTDVEMFLSTTKRSYDYSVMEMTLSPNFRVYLAPVSNTVHLANTLNNGALENV